MFVTNKIRLERESSLTTSRVTRWRMGQNDWPHANSPADEAILLVALRNRATKSLTLSKHCMVTNVE